MKLNDKATSELRQLQAKIELELIQRKSEKKLAVIAYQTGDMAVHVTPEMYQSDSYWKQNLIDSIEQGLEDMDTGVQFRITIVPESDYNDINQANGITQK